MYIDPKLMILIIDWTKVRNAWLLHHSVMGMTLKYITESVVFMYMLSGKKIQILKSEVTEVWSQFLAL